MEFRKVKLLNNELNHETKISCKQCNIFYMYWIFVILRVALNFVPQNGYIHPDEFFQSIEPIAGHYFDIDTYKPWEFNNTYPIRAIVFPYLSVGIPYLIINLIAQYFDYYFGLNLKSVYFLVLAPRIFMCLLSFINDYCLYRICKSNHLCYKECLLIFASSYVTLTYITRTFSNSIELILLALLLFYVSRCMIFSNKVVYQGNHLKKKYREAQTIVDKVKVYKLMCALPSHSLNDCLIIASIAVAGIFNRPTFIAFALCPVFFWLQRGLSSEIVGFLDFHIRIVTFIICTIPALILFILIDSFYFGYLTWGEISRLDISINSFVVTPLNFIKYNIITDNLKTHGLHPRYLHFLINVPLLFNIYGILGLYLIAQLVYRVIKKRWLQLPRIQSVEGLMIASFAVPVVLLSAIPHQEARFIVPILFPLSFCCIPMFRYFKSSTCVVDTFKKSTKASSKSTTDDPKVGRIKLIWYTCNVILTIFYGFVHQAGVLPLTSHIANELRAKPELTHIHLFTSYTYSVPTALMQLRNTRKTYYSSDNHKYKLVQDFYLYERGGEQLQNVLTNIAEKLNECEQRYCDQKLPYRMYYALPASAFDQFQQLASTYYANRFNYTKLKTFYPHLTTEMLPQSQLFQCLIVYGNMLECMNMFLAKPTESFFNFVHQFGLLLIKIVPKQTDGH